MVVREEEGDEQGKGVLGEKRMTLGAKKDSESKRVRGDLGVVGSTDGQEVKERSEGLKTAVNKNIQLLFS